MYIYTSKETRDIENMSNIKPALDQFIACALLRRRTGFKSVHSPPSKVKIPLHLTVWFLVILFL